MKTRRKILYKAIRRDTREWVFGSLIISTVVGEEYYHIQEEGTVGSRYCYPVDPETICQFWTEYKNMQLFEGDKVLVRGQKRVGDYETEIIFDGNGFTLKENKTYLKDYKMLVSIIKVIGNILD